jgi:hypothetical protein
LHYSYVYIVIFKKLGPLIVMGINRLLADSFFFFLIDAGEGKSFHIPKGHGPLPCMVDSKSLMNFYSHLQNFKKIHSAKQKRAKPNSLTSRPGL